MRETKKLFDKLKYSIIMPLNKMGFFTDRAIKSVLEAMGKREDIEFLILDDNPRKVAFTDDRIKHIRLPKMDLVNKLIVGTQLAKGQYYCNADYDDISHPNKFELFDKILKYNDIAGAHNCIFYNSKTGKMYKMRNELLMRKHLYRNETIEYPWLQHSNSAIPLEWLRKVGYGNEKRIGMAHKDSKIMTDSPIWANAQIDGLRFGFFDDIKTDAWKECIQIIHGDNVNKFTDEIWNAGYIEVRLPKPKVLL